MEEPLTRRRARAELRSWGGSTVPAAENIPEAESVPAERVPVETAADVTAGQEPVSDVPTEHAGPSTSHAGPSAESAGPSARPSTESAADDSVPQWSVPQGPAETGQEPDMDWTEAAPPEPVIQPEPAAAIAEAPSAAPFDPRTAVILPELPEAPPALPQPEGEDRPLADGLGSTAGNAFEPVFLEPELEPEPESEPESEAWAVVEPVPEAVVEPESETSPEAAVDAEPDLEAEPEPDLEAEPDVEAGHPAGLPLDPVLMPSDLRERTRQAVRGEPNDVRRATFLDTKTAKIPATRGFRGFLASLGIRIAPSARELEERRDTRMVSQHWPGPRTISVVNGKGGANKTPTTVMLAAIFARNGGGPVLAWDNNETRGTLGWRTEQAQHDATVMDLLPETGLLLSPAAQSAMLAKFVHHQTDDKYDVLRSNPNVLASEQKVTKADFDSLHSVASKYFRLNIVDSGNDESAERWLRMIDHTDQLVIATTTVEEHAEAGALLLEALQERGGKYAELARGAVVIVSQADRNGTEAQARRVAEAFKVLARAAVTIPYDPALVKGQIRYASLRPVTQRAWLRAAAAVAGGL